MVAKVLFVSSSIAAAVLFIVLQLTNPASIHPLGLLGVFVLIYTICVAVMTVLVYAGSRAIAPILKLSKGAASVRGHLSFRRAYVYGSLLAFAPVILIGMQSVGSLGFLDVLLVIIFEAVLCFYVWRRQ